MDAVLHLYSYIYNVYNSIIIYTGIIYIFFKCIHNASRLMNWINNKKKKKKNMAKLKKQPLCGGI